MNRIRQYETHQSYPHRQIVSVHGRSPDLELHAYSACLPGFPVTLPRFVALTVEWAVPDFHRIPFSCTFVQPWPVWFFCVSKFYMLLLKCQCLFPVFSSVSIILFPIFPGYVFFGFFGSFLPAFLSAKSFAFCLTANIAEKAAVWNADEHSLRFSKKKRPTEFSVRRFWLPLLDSNQRPCG